jgi:hypothetical protein
MKAKVSTITVNFNHKYFPKLSVEALEAAENPWPVEIVFVDNASTDELSLNFLRAANKDGRVKLIESPENIGFAGGNNLGAANASGEYLLILNPDTTVRKDSIEKMVSYMDKHKDVGILGPRLEYSDGTVQDSCRRDMKFYDLVLKRTFLGKLPLFKRRVEKYTMDDFDHSKIQEVELITGACMLIRKDFYDDIEGFDDRYFLFMEDFDLCKKVRAAGKKVVYYPDAIINHYHKRLSAGSIFTLIRKPVFWMHVNSARKYFWKWR